MAERDMTKLGAVQGFADWFRKKSEALCVVVIRVDDLAIAADPLLAPRDTEALLEDRAAEIHALLEAQRKEALAKIDRRNQRLAKR